MRTNKPEGLRLPSRGPGGPILAVAAVLGAASPAAAQQAEAAAGPVVIFETTIPELQRAMSSGEVTSVELVEAYLARIAAYDQRGPALNAMLRLNPAALEEAARLDRERAESGPRGPLHGIPVVVKDNYDTADMPTSAGSIALATHRPASDAHQVRLLRDAGAIIVGKTNLHELAYGITSISSLGGQTRNPYDPSRNPGGSSGGTGAAVAANYAAVGWGSDTCGSIRIPAAVNNLFGLRPTKGLSSIDGIIPLAHTQDVGGPLARSMTDLAIALDATIGPDPADPATQVLEGLALSRFSDALDAGALRGARIGVLTQYFGDSAEERETNRVTRAALDEMARLGAEIVEVDYPALSEVLSGTSVIDFEFKWDLFDYLARTPAPPVASLSEIVERGLHHRAVANVLRRSDRHATREPEGYREALAKREAALTAILGLMDEMRLDALAYPTLRREAAFIGEPAPGNNCQLSAATGMPALTIPAGFTDRDVPVGLELLGRRFEDTRLVAIGFAFEQAVAPRRPPRYAPRLVNGRAPAAIRFATVTQPAADGPAARVDFGYDPVLGTLDYDVRISGARPDEVEAVVLREGASGPVLYRLVGPGVDRSAGLLTLSPAERQGLEGGELAVQLVTARGSGPATPVEVPNTTAGAPGQ